MATMTSGVHAMRLDGETMTQAIHRTKDSDETLSEQMHDLEQTVTNNALRGIESEIGVGCIFFSVLVVRAGHTVTATFHAQRLGRVLQFTIAVGRAINAVQRMV